MVHRQRRAMQSAPRDKGPVRAMPQSAQQHGGDDVHRLAQRAAAVAAEWNVEIVAQEPRQRHVPAPPEIAHRDRTIRRIEVQRQAEPEHQRQPDRHVGIAGEIEVDLQRICTGGDPRLGRRQRRADCLAEQRIGDHRQRVRQRHLLRHADHEQHEAARQILPHRRPARIEPELMDDLVVTDNRPSNELREERDEHAEVEETVDVPITASQIDQVRDLLEHEEADAERQDQVPGPIALTQQGDPRCRGRSRHI